MRWRLPFLIAVLTVLGVATFVGVAYREVRTNLLRAAAARTQDTAERLAGLFSQSTQQRLLELHRVAGTEALRRFLQQPTDAAREEAARALTGALVPNRAPTPQTIEIWTRGGVCALSLDTRTQPATPVACGTKPAKAGAGPFTRRGDALYAESAAEITTGGSDGAESGASLGLLVVRRPIGVGPSPDMLSGLIGNGVTIFAGNVDDDVWTDFVHAMPPPPVERHRPGVMSYRDASNQVHSGALANIRGTPWAVWVEFPRALVLAPARAFLQRMILIAAVFIALAVVVIWAFTARITVPLHGLTLASEAVAGGDYSRRVEIARHDEIGRLGLAFNMMGDRVASAYQELEERVRQRTARLEEAGTLLEQRARESRDARDELDRFFSLSLDLLCIARTDGRFLRVNPAFERVLGWTAEELTSAPYDTFVHPADRESTDAQTASLASGGQAVDFENRYRHRDGSYRWLSWKAASIPDRGLIYAAARDITVEKRVALDREQHLETLASLNRELEAFSYSVSHDLRAPLRHITGFAALLTRSADASLDAESRRYLRVITDAAASMGRLIDDLLAFSRVGRTPLNRTRVDLNQLVSDAKQEALTDVSATRSIRWTIADLPQVYGDATLLRLVLVNLLSNAIKYSSTRPEARIEVGVVAVKHDETTIVVRDNGVGFDMQYADKLFGVFQRLHSSDQFDGTGIGLANVRRIVQRHGGRTWAEGTVDGGAAFYVSLPNKETHAS